MQLKKLVNLQKQGVCYTLRNRRKWRSDNRLTGKVK
nr:MAG TPA: hypothetical protein [Caudoviricetes sp.]